MFQEENAADTLLMFIYTKVLKSIGAVSYKCLKVDMYKKCYNRMFQAAENGKINLASKVKHIIFSVGFGYIWEQQLVHYAAAFIAEFVVRVKAI